MRQVRDVVYWNVMSSVRDGCSFSVGAIDFIWTMVFHASRIYSVVHLVNDRVRVVRREREKSV